MDSGGRETDVSRGKVANGSCEGVGSVKVWGMKKVELTGADPEIK